jgi:type I restriction enzyme R subunit
MTAKQLLFMEQIVDYISVNGVMSPHSLFEPPFTHLHDLGVDGLFPDQAGKIVRIIQQINSNAEMI